MLTGLPNLYTALQLGEVWCDGKLYMLNGADGVYVLGVVGDEASVEALLKGATFV